MADRQRGRDAERRRDAEDRPRGSQPKAHRDRSRESARPGNAPARASAPPSTLAPPPTAAASEPAKVAAGARTQQPVDDSNGTMIELFLNDRLGRKVRVFCNTTDTVGELKLLVAAQTGTRPEKLRIQKWCTFRSSVTKARVADRRRRRRRAQRFRRHDMEGPHPVAGLRGAEWSVARAVLFVMRGGGGGGARGRRVSKYRNACVTKRVLMT